MLFFWKVDGQLQVPPQQSRFPMAVVSPREPSWFSDIKRFAHFLVPG